MIGDYRIILASNSPRRKELLAGLDIDFEVRVKDGIDESYPECLSMEEIPEYISLNKARAYDLADDELLITADTIVYLDGEVLGKPHDRDEACEMLRRLSGKVHQVVTGVTLKWRKKSSLGVYGDMYRSFSTVTEVGFDTLSDSDIVYYVDKYKPFDKAGAYGIQEWIGYVGVTGIKGSYFNVMGLPVQRLSKELNKF